MDKKEMLRDWVINYLKHKDYILQDIVEINPSAQEYDVEIKRKTKNQSIILAPLLKEANESLLKDEAIAIITLNNKENVDALLSKWELLSGLPKLCVYFVNPSASSDRHWTIYPHTHSQLADKSSLKRGLLALFSSIEPFPEGSVTQIDISS